jgi:hypothetical protein
LLHEGKNLVTVVVSGNQARAGLRRGGSLRIETPAGQWKRSLFNGLAQVIVQGKREAGEISLRTMSRKLSAGEVRIEAQKATPRPTLE